MKTSLIKVGNSRGVRLPKSLIEQANLGENLELTVKNNSIIISPGKNNSVHETTLLSEAALNDWNSPEEDKAWAHLQ